MVSINENLFLLRKALTVLLTSWVGVALFVAKRNKLQLFLRCEQAMPLQAMMMFIWI